MEDKKVPENSNSSKKVKTILLIMVFVSIVGFSDATYLSFKYFRSDPIVCPVLADGCLKVSVSKYAEFYGIPTPFFGTAFYLAMFTLVFWYFRRPKKLLLDLIGLLALAGFLASLVLTFVQYYILESFCFYCLISAASSLLIFICGCSILFLVGKIPNGEK